MFDIFSGLEELGFNNVDIDLYKNEKTEENKKDEENKNDPLKLLYDKTIDCPVCNTQFKTKTVKVGKARLISQDTDFMPIYENINPLFYDVIICPKCGYAAMVSYFNKIRQFQIELILNNITPKFKPKKYPDVYDVDIAIERYKFSLLNCAIKNAKSSEKAFNCLKIAWMYRLKKDTENELKFLELAYIGFKEALEKEPFPVCNMDQYTLMYLIGELARRIGKKDEALIWFGQVIIAKNARTKIKELAREQKDLIKSSVN
ncbi:hypothetical protein SAMN05660865_00413 [Caloramator fervidus]|uniref:DUF2225 domain-containing protein n=1 Tax=Caloramator fervidus TaxID=29344 RepID=A0A1H5SMJ2_9CLOT|nr:DUF2225 domain-containing protein [Caloramator fervidus]SEF51745.1 hypothetical protein SAMN05660865_00413 [Caloramator fervidus]